MPTPDTNLCVILLAAGASNRFRTDAGAALGGGGLGARSKLDEDLGGRPVLHRSLELFTDRPEVRSIIVAGPRNEEAMDSFRLRHIDKLNVFGATLIPGGESTRAQSVAAALAHVPEEATHVAVHDAARPIASAAMIDRVIEAATSAGPGHAAVIPAVPVSDTIKRGDDETVDTGNADPFADILGAAAGPAQPARRIAGTIDRTNLFAAQTPQVFAADLLRRAYKHAGAAIDDPAAASDDASLIEQLGEPVLMVEGDPGNIKITRPVDLVIARAIAGFKPPKPRPDLHKF